MTDDSYTIVTVESWTPSNRGFRRDRSVEEQFRELYRTSSGPSDTWTLIGEDGVVAQYPTNLDDADDAEPMRVIVVRSPGDVSAWCPGCGDPADPVYAAVGVDAFCDNEACPVSEFDPGHPYYDAEEASDGGD